MRYAAVLALLGTVMSQDAPRATAAAGNPITQYFDAKWNELNVRPNRPSGDEEFLRRVTLDLLGTLPEPEEILAFVKSTDSKKRERKIDELLADADWPEFWSERFAAILLGTRDRKRMAAYEPIRQFMHDQLSKKVRYDAIVEDLITAKGTSTDPGHANAFVLSFLYKDKTQKKDLAVQVSKVFMGVQLQCAQCHDHPFERWTKDDFFSVVANFAGTNVRVAEKGDPKNKRDDVLEIVDRRGRGGYRPEGYKVEVKPKFYDGQAIDGESIREAFAKRLIASENLQFARATVNRIWSLFTGQGFVEPIDDFSIKNPAVHPELLESLAKGFVQSKYDLQWLMRTIVTSRVYQLSSRRKADEFPAEVRKLYAYALVRPMVPEQQLGALLRAQGLEGETGRGAGKLGKARELFMRDADMGDSPGVYNTNIQQIMRMLNMDAPIYQGTKARGRGRLAQILRDTRDPEQVFTKLYLATASRMPTRDELAHCMGYYKEHGSSTPAFEDIFFVLLNTNEFFFNH